MMTRAGRLPPVWNTLVVTGSMRWRRWNEADRDLAVGFR